MPGRSAFKLRLPNRERSKSQIRIAIAWAIGGSGRIPITGCTGLATTSKPILVKPSWRPERCKDIRDNLRAGAVDSLTHGIDVGALCSCLPDPRHQTDGLDVLVLGG